MRITTFLISLFLITPSFALNSPTELAKEWIASIKEQSRFRLNKMIHPLCKKEDINPTHLNRMLAGPIPKDVSIKIHDLKNLGAHASYFKVPPTKQISLKYNVKTMEDKKKYGLGKGFPAANYNGKWYFVVCMNRSN